MPTREIELVTPLLDEVVDWALTGCLFVAPGSPDNDRTYRFTGGAIPLGTVDVPEWYRNIDINNEESSFVALVDVAKRVRSAYFLIHAFGESEFTDYHDERYSVAFKALTSHPSTTEFAQMLYELRPNAGLELDDVVGCVRSTLEAFLGMIFSARTVSLSKRHALSEAIFYGYRQGLFPFGWDWETLICLDPEEIRRNRKARGKSGKGGATLDDGT